MVEKGKAGRGNVGGIREYARVVGMDHGDLSRYISGAQVFDEIGGAKNGGLYQQFPMQQFTEKAQHLYEISQATKRATTVCDPDDCEHPIYVISV